MLQSLPETAKSQSTEPRLASGGVIRVCAYTPLCLKKDLDFIEQGYNLKAMSWEMMILGCWSWRCIWEESREELIELLGFIYAFTCMRAQHLAIEFEIGAAAPKSLILIVES